MPRPVGQAVLTTEAWTMQQEAVKSRAYSRAHIGPLAWGTAEAKAAGLHFPESPTAWGVSHWEI